MKIMLYIAVLSLSACSLKEEHVDNINQNNGWIEALEAEMKSLENLDSTAINKQRTSRLERLVEVEDLLAISFDTLDSLLAHTMLNISHSGEPYHPFSLDRTHAQMKLVHSANQLKALNHDLEHNLLPADSVDIMLQTERLAAKMAVEKAQRIRQAGSNEAHKTEAWLLQIDSLIEHVTTP
jgi:hypothetical protein